MTLRYPLRHRRVALRAMTLACSALIVLTSVAPAAVAEPAGSGRPADAPTVAMRDLGTDPTLTFNGMQATRSLTIPVPQGLRTAALTADVELPVNLFMGSISVIQDGRTVSSVDLPAVDRAPVSLPLDGAEVRDNALTVEVRSNLVPPQGYCAYDDTDPLQLVNTAVAFTGVERTPTAIADFLPPVLQRLSVFLPDRPTTTESDAAVRLAAAVVARYGTQPVRVETYRLDGDEPLGKAEPLERQVVIREGDPDGMKLLGSEGVPSLELSGSADDLTNQIRLITNDAVVPLALSSGAAPGQLDAPAVDSADSITLRDLGTAGLTATSLTGPRVNVAIDQTRLGRPSHGVRVHLKGSYTPLPQHLNGQLVVRVDDEILDRWAVEPSGSIDRWVDVPDRLLSRTTDLSVMINATGDTRQCGESLPLTLTLDGDSEVVSTPANPPIPPGFQSIPQAFLPRVQVGIADESFDDTVRAVTLIAGLQRLSAVPVDTSVVALDDAIRSQEPAVLIAADGWTDEQLTLPVDASAEALSLDSETPTGSLQTVRNGERTLLVATSNGAPGELDNLLTWLNDDPRRWQRLDGAAVVAAEDREPFTVPAAPVAASEPAQQEGGSTTSYWLVGLTVVVAAALGVGVVYLRTRRS